MIILSLFIKCCSALQKRVHLAVETKLTGNGIPRGHKLYNNSDGDKFTMSNFSRVSYSNRICHHNNYYNHGSGGGGGSNGVHKG